jgi:NAD(P)-dependent dehydrogenase (short-subunit alcohol dehydrogenase family)
MGTRLEGRTALVTGATSNIGRAIAVAMAAEGAHVVVSGRNRARGEQVVDLIRRNGGVADLVVAELTGSAQGARELAAAATLLAGGRIDILVNNAGIYPSPTTAATDDETFDRVYAVNVKAPFFLTAALAPEMARRGWGAVINLGSWIVRLGLPTGALYSSSKGALETLTRAWSAEFGPSGVRVNTISPGVTFGTDSPLSEAAAVRQMMHGTPAGTVVSPEAIGQAAVFLASDDASFVHGTVLDVDGGRTQVAVVAG